MVQCIKSSNKNNRQLCSCRKFEHLVDWINNKLFKIEINVRIRNYEMTCFTNKTIFQVL